MTPPNEILKNTFSLCLLYFFILVQMKSKCLAFAGLWIMRQTTCTLMHFVRWLVYPQQTQIFYAQIKLAVRRLWGFWLWFLFASNPLNPMLVCLFDALLVSWPYCSFHPSFNNWPLFCIFTFIKLYNMMIEPFQKIPLHAASTGSDSELWQLSYSAELFGNFKFCSLFREFSVTPIMHSRLHVKERGRDLICWRLPPISFKRLLIDNGEGERWTLNRHSNYRL